MRYVFGYSRGIVLSGVRLEFVALVCMHAGMH
jgi:hypothetical protein